MSQGGEKTEKATPKKRRDARERGQVMKSQEIITAFCMLCMFGFMLGYAPTLIDGMRRLMADYLSSAVLLSGRDALGPGASGGVFWDIALRGVLLAAPILGVAMASGLAANLLQVGFMFTTKALAPKFERINPLKGVRRMFSFQTLVQLFKSLLKVVVLGYIFYTDYVKMLADFPGFLGRDPHLALIEILRLTFSLALKMSLAMAAIAAADFLYQFFKFERDLRMSKQEVKDEYKLSEGDPQIKSRIRQKQRQMSMMRMMDAVPHADVVITNPTHLAIALKYDAESAGAPKVLAKGQDHLALRIRDTARRYRVSVVENKPLAQALYRLCQIDQEIPEELYQAVAEVLAFVYRQKQGPAARTHPPERSARP